MGQKLNDRLERVQVGREDVVPVFRESASVWFLWIKDNGEWDAATPIDYKEIIPEIKKAQLVFAVWHGEHRTNLFLMDKPKLLEKLLQLKEPK